MQTADLSQIDAEDLTRRLAVEYRLLDQVR